MESLFTVCSWILSQSTVAQLRRFESLRRLCMHKVPLSIAFPQLSVAVENMKLKIMSWEVFPKKNNKFYRQNFLLFVRISQMHTNKQSDQMLAHIFKVFSLPWASCIGKCKALEFGNFQESFKIIWFRSSCQSSLNAKYNSSIRYALSL